jgi:hypothetical protein
MYKIIYPNESTISIITPSPNNKLPIQDIAKKQVPKNIPYKIISADDLPSDRTFRNAWVSDFNNPDGFGEGDSL